MIKRAYYRLFARLQNFSTAAPGLERALEPDAIVITITLVAAGRGNDIMSVDSLAKRNAAYQKG